MKKSKIVLVITVIAAICIAGAAAVIFLSLQPNTWTVTITASVEAKLIHPDWVQDYGINYPDWTNNPAWYNNQPSSYIMFGSNNVADDIYLTITAAGPFITAGGTVSAELIIANAAVSGGVTLTETSLQTIPDVNTMTPYDIPLNLIDNGYPTANLDYLRIDYTYTPGTTTAGDYPVTITINLTDNGA